MNALLKKGYLLAGVIIAANMFAVNDVKAMDKDRSEDNTISTLAKIITIDITRHILYWENYFNFFGTLALSGANNYFKWWDYNPGWYRQFGCLGWRSKRLLNGIFQFEVNFINLGRGISWGFLGFWFLFVQKGTSIRIKTACSLTISSLFFITRNNDIYQVQKEKQLRIKVIAFLLLILQGFVSIPMTLHLSNFNFSISISLDSILWELVAKWAREKKVKIHLELMNIWVDKNKNAL